MCQSCKTVLKLMHMVLLSTSTHSVEAGRWVSGLPNLGSLYHIHDLFCFLHTLELKTGRFRAVFLFLVAE